MNRARRSGAHAPSHRVFFALACLQAALAVPLWWAEWSGVLPGLPTASAARHVHEMLMGFALAVMGGFLFTAIGSRTLALAVAAWIAGRVAAMASIGGWPEAVAGLAFPVMLMVLAGVPFVRSARSGHNLVFAPVMFGFLGAEALYQAGRLGLLAGGAECGIWLAFDLVMLMLLVMAGRLLPAAMAGLVRQMGGELTGRNRPNLERAEIGGMVLAIVAHVGALPGEVAWLGWSIAGAASLARQYYWKPVLSIRQPGLWPLHLGHIWLGGGLVAAGLAGLTGMGPVNGLVHAVTIGGLGTITATMMIRTTMLRGRISCPFPRTALAAIALLSIAAGLRVAGANGAAAIIWAAAFLGVLWALLSLNRFQHH